MRKLHTIVGIVFAVAFILTGQYMRWRQPPEIGLDETVRMLYRSTHIYILAGALVNLAVGGYYTSRTGRARHVLQMIGSVFIIIPPPLLLWAFFTEPLLAHLQRPYTLPAIVMLAIGTLLHLISGIGQVGSVPVLDGTRE